MSASKPSQHPLAYYDLSTGKFWWLTPDNVFIPLNDTAFQRVLHCSGASPKTRGNRPSDLDTAMRDYQSKAWVNWATPLAGYSQGLIKIGDLRILVTSSPQRVTPAPGPCDQLRSVMLDNILVDFEGNNVQVPYTRAWLKFACQSVYVPGARQVGQAFVLAGPPDCGKSFWQNMLTRIMGYRSAKPYRYMSGATPFNSDLFMAEHLMIEDEVASTQLAKRRHFGQVIKQFTAAESQSCHPKGRPAFTLYPCWRLTVSLNDEPENMLILPPMERSVADKIMLIQAYKRPMPMPTVTPADRQRFLDTLISQIPAFVYELLHWEVPPELVDKRFGVKTFHHPGLLTALGELSPEQQLAELIDLAVLDDRDEWEGRASDLTAMLMESSVMHVRDTAKKLLSWPTATSCYLARLEAQDPEHYLRKHSRQGRVWTLRRNGVVDGEE